MKCKHCGEPIIGGKGDYFHAKGGGGYGDMKCADGKNLAEPETEVLPEEPMRNYEVTFKVITEAPNEDQAVEDAKDLISQRRFEPLSVAILP